ncbi:MAG: hypothetical protein NWF03_08570 [Candidatus Bathyarchaeota archaeon]|nr:hypothetical protein [Candidatus Bathyarchaeota archaeon]
MNDAIRSLVKFAIFAILLFALFTYLMGPEFALLIVIIVVVASMGGLMDRL